MRVGRRRWGISQHRRSSESKETLGIIQSDFFILEMGKPGLPEVKDSPNGSSQLLLKQGPSLLPPGPVPFKRRGRQSLLYSLGYGSNITGALQVAFLLGALIRFPSGHFPVIPNTWLSINTEVHGDALYISALHLAKSEGKML